MNLYNEIDPYAAAWLRNLVERGCIPAGVVDERSIVDLDPDYCARFTQCHFFAGIGGWSYALRLAGIPDDRPVWTGSCPCQPFSAAGAQRGSDDERHLWPAFFRLIRECRPATVVGEQVAGAAGLAWLDHVCADLEGAGYAAAAADLPACSVGAPHRRQRLYWVAHAGQEQRRRGPQRPRPNSQDEAERHEAAIHDQRRCAARTVADADAPGQRLEWRGGLLDRERQAQRHDADGCGALGMGDASDARLAQRIGIGRVPGATPGDGARQTAVGAGVPIGAVADADEQRRAGDHGAEPGVLEGTHRSVADGGAGPWADLEWLACTDGKARPTQPGLQPLAHGIPGRVGRLRAYGNAIVPQLAAVFVRAALGVHE